MYETCFELAYSLNDDINKWYNCYTTCIADCTEGEQEAAWLKDVGLEEVAAFFEREFSSLEI
jgi:hypothetical protein